MTMHDALDRETREQAALYALGALPADEADAYRDHLDRCSLCRNEVTTLRAPVEELARLTAEAEPSPGLRSRVLEAARASQGARHPMSETMAQAIPATAAGEYGTEKLSPRDTASPMVHAVSRAQAPVTVYPGGLDLAFSADAVWEKSSIEGIEMRTLSIDEAADRATVLIRMGAGTSYPSHRHGGPEECYVIAGDLTTGDIRMRAGDYKLAHKGSVDSLQSTENGCLLLIVSSLRDEVLPPAAGPAAR